MVTQPEFVTRIYEGISYSTLYSVAQNMKHAIEQRDVNPIPQIL
jgi:hypothetical protein